MKPIHRAAPVIAAAFVLAVTTAAQVATAAPTATEVASWRGAYGWEWDRIPAGTKVRMLVKFDLPTLLYPEPKDGPQLASLPDGEPGDYLGKYKDGFVQVRTRQGTGWVDYRLAEPIAATR